MRFQNTRGTCHGKSLFLSKLGEERGDFTLNSAFMLLFAMILLVLFISVLGVVNNAMKLQSVTAELTRYIEIRGQVDSAVYTELNRLASVAGVAVENRTIEATYENGNKIQYGSSFTVTLSTTGHFGVGGVLQASVPLSATVSGRSEVYWK